MLEEAFMGFPAFLVCMLSAPPWIKYYSVHIALNNVRTKLFLVQPQSTHTQIGTGRFLAYSPSRRRNYPRLVRGGGGVHALHAHPLSLQLPSREKLQYKLQLRGQVHSPYFISTHYVLCGCNSKSHLCALSKLVTLSGLIDLIDLIDLNLGKSRDGGGGRGGDGGLSKLRSYQKLTFFGPASAYFLQAFF